MFLDKKTRTSLFFFFLALFFAYSPFWVPYYVNFFQTEKISILGKISQYHMPCKEEAVGNAYCSDQYVIPKSIFPSNVSDPSLGLGNIVIFLKLGCFENNKFIPLHDVDINKIVYHNYQTLHKYHVLSYSIFHECRDAIAVQSWVAKYDARHGYYAGLLTFGNTLAVERVKKLIEFIVGSIPQDAAAIAFVIFIMFSHYFNMVGVNAQTRTFFSLVPFWFFTFLFTSGALLVFIPIDTHTRVFSRIGCYFSMFSHLLVGVYSFKKNQPFTHATTFLNKVTSSFYRGKNILLGYFFTPASLFFLVLVCIPCYSYSFGVTSLSIGLFLLFFGRRDLNLFLFSFCYVLAMFKFFNVENAPMSNASFYFVAFLFSQEAYSLINDELRATLYGLIRKSTNDEKLAAQVVHDIRSPIAVLKLLLSQIHWNDDKNEIKDVVLSSLEQISSISKDVLKKFKNEIKTSESADLGIVRRLVYENQLFPEKIKWDLQINSDLEKKDLQINKTIFIRVLQNLFNNARESIGVKNIRVKVLQQDSENVSIVIQNDGELIPKNILESVLIRGGSYKKENGTGMGVVYSKNEVEMNGGIFLLESQDGWTTCMIQFKTKVDQQIFDIT